MLDAAQRSLLKQFFANMLRERNTYFADWRFKEVKGVKDGRFYLYYPKPVKVDDIMEAHQKLLGDLIKDEDVAGVLKWHRKFLEEVNDASGKEKGEGNVTGRTWLQSEKLLRKLADSNCFFLSPKLGAVLDFVDSPDFRYDSHLVCEWIHIQQNELGRVAFNCTDKYGRRDFVVNCYGLRTEPLQNPIPKLLTIEVKCQVRLKDGWDLNWFLKLHDDHQSDSEGIAFSELLRSLYPEAIDLYDDLDKQRQQPSGEGKGDVPQEGSHMPQGAGKGPCKARGLGMRTKCLISLVNFITKRDPCLAKDLEIKTSHGRGKRGANQALKSKLNSELSDNPKLGEYRNIIGDVTDSNIRGLKTHHKDRIVVWGGNAPNV